MPTVLLLLSIALAMGAQALQVTRTYLFAPPFLNLLAILGLAAALRGQGVSPTTVGDSPPPPGDARTKWIGRGFTLIGFALAAGCSAWLYRDWVAALFSAFLVGPLALLYLATGQDILWGYGNRRWFSSSAIRDVLRRRETQLVLIVLLVAVFFRFVSIGDFPPTDGFSSIEESQRASGARMIIEKGGRPWEFPLAQYLAAAAFSTFGYSIHALRVPVTILGCLTVIPFYLLVRECVAVPAALFSTLLLAVSRWHVQVSWYNEDVYVPLSVFVVALCLLIRTRRIPRPAYYLIIGACGGYALYEYAGFRVTGLIALAFFVGEAFRIRRLPSDWRQVLLFVGVLVLFVWPLVGIIRGAGTDFYFEALGRSLANRDYYTSDPQLFFAQRLERIRETADAFTFSDHEAFFISLNARREPLLDPFTSVAFVLGFGTTLLYARKRYHAFFVLTFLFLTTGATVVVQNFDFRRLSSLIPFVFVFIALVADKIDRFAAQHRAQRLYWGVLAATAVLAGLYNYHFLFHVLARDHAARAYHRDHYSVAAFYLHDHYRDEHVVLLTPDVTNFFLPNDYDWIKPPGLRGQVALDVESLFPVDAAAADGREVLLLIQRHFDIATIMEQVREFYPNSACELRKDPDDRQLDMGVCRVPFAAAQAARGLGWGADVSPPSSP